MTVATAPGPRASSLGRSLGVLSLAAGALAALWLFGLLLFAAYIPRLVADPRTRTDAIVVLTGGSLRLDQGLALLEEGRAEKLFVSGVDQGVTLEVLLRLQHRAPGELAARVVLGHEADNTLGNARETAEWMQAERYRSLRLVTGAYHMPRALLEFSRAMPEVTIIPNPVFPRRVKRAWWAWPGTASLIIGEYSKFLFALVRPALLPPDPQQGRSERQPA